MIGLAAAVSFWFVISVETHTFFVARALAERVPEDAAHQRWLGQMALSVVWAVYAGALAAAGFIRRVSAIRWASLVLFALTIVKVMLVDIARLEQLYRIIVFFVLGVLLLLVAWAYHKAFQITGAFKMKRFGSYILVLIAATVLVISVAAQTSLSLWPYYVEVSTQSRTRPDFMTSSCRSPSWTKLVRRLMTCDSSTLQIARYRTPFAFAKTWMKSRRSMQKIFNCSRSGSLSEASVDLGEDPGDHNEVEVETTGTNFRRQVTVEGSDSDRDWKMLKNDGVIFSFSSQNDSVDSNTVSYPTSRYRYLRIRVQRDELNDREAPKIDGVKAMMAVREQGQLASWNVPVPYCSVRTKRGRACLGVDHRSRRICPL